MLHFESDYVKGAHPQVLQALIETNDLALSGYGTDELTQQVVNRIQQLCGDDSVEVALLTGGTQTNLIVISSVLHSYEGVIAVSSGHICTHEAGAIERTGHKVLTLPHHDGKMSADDLANYLATYHADVNRRHMVRPGMVYISHPTEYGTLYTKDELKQLFEVCQQYTIPLFIDGARLGYGLMADDTDVTLCDIVRYSDVFYIGGTKIGALCGEAVVFTRVNQSRFFQSVVKQHGALLAKGRLLSAQFKALLEDNLYFDISRHAIEMAHQLKALLQQKGYRFYTDSPTNQQFVIVNQAELERLQTFVQVGIWGKYDDAHTIVRFTTSWSTTQDEIDTLATLL